MRVLADGWATSMINRMRTPGCPEEFSAEGQIRSEQGLSSIIPVLVGWWSFIVGDPGTALPSTAPATIRLKDDMSAVRLEATPRAAVNKKPLAVGLGRAAVAPLLLLWSAVSISVRFTVSIKLDFFSTDLPTTETK